MIFHKTVKSKFLLGLNHEMENEVKQSRNNDFQISDMFLSQLGNYVTDGFKVRISIPRQRLGKTVLNKTSLALQDQ